MAPKKAPPPLPSQAIARQSSAAPKKDPSQAAATYIRKGNETNPTLPTTKAPPPAMTEKELREANGTSNSQNLQPGIGLTPPNKFALTRPMWQTEGGQHPGTRSSELGNERLGEQCIENVPMKSPPMKWGTDTTNWNGLCKEPPEKRQYTGYSKLQDHTRPCHKGQ